MSCSLSQHVCERLLRMQRAALPAPYPTDMDVSVDLSRPWCHISHPNSLSTAGQSSEEGRAEIRQQNRSDSVRSRPQCLDVRCSCPTVTNSYAKFPFQNASVPFSSFKLLDLSWSWVWFREQYRACRMSDYGKAKKKSIYFCCRWVTRKAVLSWYFGIIHIVKDKSRSLPTLDHRDSSHRLRIS